MSGEMSTQEGLKRIVDSLEGINDSLAPIGDFMATLDEVLQNWPDTERLTPASFVRQYKRVSEELESESDEEE